MLHHYWSSNLGLKHGPLITALVDPVKLLLKILVLLKSFQTESMTTSSQKLDVLAKEFSFVDTVITSCLDTPRQHQRNL